MSEEESKELHIEKLNYTKQLINEGWKPVRDHIEQVILPLCGDDQHLLRWVKSAKREYYAGGKTAKKEIDNAVAYVDRPEVPLDRLPEELSYWVTEEWIAPFFIPVIFCCRAILRDDLEWFANRMARRHHGNVIRGVAFSSYEPHWKKKGWMFYPYKKNASGKFVLTDYDFAYFDELCFRLEAFVQRNLFPFIDLVDHSGLHKNRPGFWNDHPWNPKNNANGTSDNPLMIFHFMEEQHKSKPGVKETGELSQKFYRDLVNYVYERFGDRVGFTAGNEVPARIEWHNILQDIIRSETRPDFPRRNMITSMILDNFYKVDIYKQFIYSLHSCCDPASYAKRDKIIPDKKSGQLRSKKYIVSQDGCFPMKTMDAQSDFVFQVLKDGRAGFEGNLRPIFVKKDGEWTSVGGDPDKVDWTLRSTNFAFAEAVKIGWLRYRNDVDC